jgi:hypothetical protein
MRRRAAGPRLAVCGYPDPDADAVSGGGAAELELEGMCASRVSVRRFGAVPGLEVRDHDDPGAQHGDDPDADLHAGQG